MLSSSPTPRRQPAKTLIPSSPAIHPKTGTYNRNKLRATSSSERFGSTGIKGLSNWRRQAKPPRPSGNSGAGSGSTTSGKDGKSKMGRTSESADSADAGARSRSGAPSTFSGKRSRGLGMGMTGTPAKRVRKSGKISIGTHSTPLRQSAVRQRNLGSGTDIDTTPNEEQGIDPLEAPSSSFRLSSADQLTSPSISEPDASPILVRANISRTLRFDSYDSLFSPHNDDDDDKEDTLFPAARDMLVPLNDLSSATSLARSDSKSSHRSGNAVETEDEHAAQSRNETLFHDTPTPSKTRIYDYTIPLNDLPSPLRDLSVPLNDITPRKRDSYIKSASNSKTPSRPGSKISERQSTPYRLPGTDRTPPPSDSIDDTDMGEPDSAMVSDPEEGRSSYRSEVDQINSDRFDQDHEIEEDTYEPLGPLQNRHSLEEELMVALETSRQLQSNPVTPPPAARRTIPSSAEDAVHNLGPQGALSLSLFDRHSFRIYGMRTSSSASEGLSWQEDPFGFQQMETALKGKRPIPYHYSSQTSSPVGPPSPSPISFAASTPPLSAATRSRSTSVSSDDENPPLTPLTGPRRISGKWRGAEYLKRMQGGVSLNPDTVDTSQSDVDDNDYDDDADEDVSVNRKPRVRARKRRTRQDERSVTPEMPEKVLKARQARMKHYEDLKINYELHVEYVLW
ncbi:hypothetical protein IAT40_006162 [Kwoniella sp. CBS 6097]